MRYVVLGLVAFGLAFYVLGPFVLPAVIGVLVSGTIAVRRGIGFEEAIRIVVPVAVLLLILGFVLSLLLVPTAWIERGRDSSMSTSGAQLVNP